MLLSRLSTGAPEMFATVQGEGVTAGVPSVFVRLAECNLRCTWCDTKYTWDWQNHDRTKETIELPVAEVAAKLFELAGPIRNAVFTGGEPLIQQDELAELAAIAKAQGFRTEIETNGTIVPSESLAAQIDQWNVSPKLATSGNGERARHRPNALQWFAAAPNAWFKFVVTNDADIAEVNELVGALNIRDRVILSPEGTTAATLSERSRWLADECQRHSYRLGTRLHVFVWGQERAR